MKTKIAVIAASLIALSATAPVHAGGEDIYKARCQGCHASGVAGAPKLGDTAAWAPRIATGMDALVASVTNGKNAMPPMGTCMDCSAEDISAAVDYMVNSSQ